MFDYKEENVVAFIKEFRLVECVSVKCYTYPVPEKTEVALLTKNSELLFSQLPLMLLFERLGIPTQELSRIFRDQGNNKLYGFKAKGRRRLATLLGKITKYYAVEGETKWPVSEYHYTVKPSL